MNKRYFEVRRDCPTCKSTDTREIYSCSFLKPPIREFLKSFYLPQGKIEFEYLKEADFVLEECNGCGTIFQKEIPNSSLMNKLYEEWIDPRKVFGLDSRKDNLSKFSYYAQEIMMIIAFFNKMPSQLKLFDFGMGWGKWCYMAKAFGCNSYGAELSKTRVEYAQSQGIRVITWDEIPDYSFDFINTEQVFEHIPEPLETLRYLKKSLKQDGLIKISVPNGEDIKRRLKIGNWMSPKGSKNSLNPVSPLEHINCFKQDSITKMADIAGLELAKMPMTSQLVYAKDWKGMKQVIKSLAKFIYGNIHGNLSQKGTYLLFRQKKNSTLLPI
ncbi:MAG: class I SAM-dependent methyltransferase [Candidatus Omnitrophica bacterium]|nr:class I SAM-dependent methyltransferase [Candidatus Omnitrophota bacterium]